jgi:hypothetical protein
MAADGGEEAAAMDTCSGDGGADGGSSQLCYALDESLVCLHFARGLLLAQPDWELASFEREWGRRVPEVRQHSLWGETETEGRQGGSRLMEPGVCCRHLAIHSLVSACDA